MYGVENRLAEQCGDDLQERLTLSFDQMFARENQGPLGDLYKFWMQKRDSGEGLPSEETFTRRELLPESCQAFTAWVDASTPDPLNYVVRNHPSMSDWGNQSNLRLGQLSSKMNAKSCAREYLTCKSIRRPMYHEIEQTVGSNSRHYVRLLLPVLNDANSVTKLVYAVRMFSATGLRAPSTSS